MTADRDNLTRAVADLQRTATLIGPAVRQLHEWTGGYASTCLGASPPSGPSDGDPPALPDDPALRELDRIRTLVARLTATITTLNHPLTPPTFRAPDESDRHAAAVSWCLQALNAAQIGTQTPIRGICDDARALAITVANVHPPAAPTIVDNCHAHQRAGLAAAVDPSYRRHYLCRWCGDFRSTYGTPPPPKVVTLHDRGIRMTPSILKRHGIRTAS